MENGMNKKGDYSLVKIRRASASGRTAVQRMYDPEEQRRSAYVFIENNTVMVSLLSALFIPYILGMLLTLVLFYFYIGISVTDFFHVYSGFSQFIFWVLGAYLIITIVDVWLLSRKFLFGRN
jgi:hypothetical protein